MLGSAVFGRHVPLSDVSVARRSPRHHTSLVSASDSAHVMFIQRLLDFGDGEYARQIADFVEQYRPVLNSLADR